MDDVFSLLRGNFGNEGEATVPIHPALVHLPLVLFPLSAILRAIGWYTSYNVPGTYQWSHYLNIAGLLSSIPTALTGFAEYKAIPENSPAQATVQSHMLMNTVVVCIALYNWWSIKNSYDYVPSQTNVLLGLVGIAIIFFSGHLGGKLVYEYNLGVGRKVSK